MEEEELPTPSLLQCAHTTIFPLPIGGGASHNFSYPQWMGTPRSREKGGWDGGRCGGRDVGRGGRIAQNSISKTFYTFHHMSSGCHLEMTLWVLCLIGMEIPQLPLWHYPLVLHGEVLFI